MFGQSWGSCKSLGGFSNPKDHGVPLFHHSTKKSRQKFKFLENKKSFQEFFINFKELSLKQTKQIFWKMRARLKGQLLGNIEKGLKIGIF